MFSFLLISVSLCDFGIRNLTDENYANFVASNVRSLVCIYENGGDRSLFDAFERFAEIGGDSLPRFRVELSENAGVRSALSEINAPNLLFFEGGEWIRYNGNANSAEIARFVESLAESERKARFVASIEELTFDERKSPNALFYEVLSLKTCFAVSALLDLLAKRYDFPVFCVVSAANGAERYALRFQRAFADEKTYESAEPLSAKLIKNFVEAYNARFCSELGDSVLPRLFGRASANLLLFAAAADPLNAAAERALARSGQSLGCWRVDPAHAQWPTLSRLFALSRYALPFAALLAFDENGPIKYALFDASPERFEDFLAKYERGELPRYYNAESVPTSQGELVKRIVRGNFDEIVNGEKRVFLAFVSRFCRGGLTAFVRLTEIAEALRARHSDVQFAVVDAQLNDIEGAPFRSLPYSLLYEIGSDRRFEVFDGDFDAEKISDFLTPKNEKFEFENEF